MRIYEGNYAYEVEQVLDPATLIRAGWRYKVYRVRPVEQVLSSGDVPTREGAEQAGKRALSEVMKSDAQQSGGRKTAA